MKIIRSKAGNFRQAVHYNENKCDSTIGDLLQSDPEKYQELVSGLGEDGVFDLEEDTVQAERIGGNVPEFESQDKINGYFNQFANTNTRVSKQCLHAKVSFDPSDVLESSTLSDIGDEVMEELGYQHCPYITYRHFDEPHPHIHIVASRVDKKGAVVSDSFDGLKSKVIERELEKKYGLVSSQEKRIKNGVRLPSYWEDHYQNKHQALSVKNYVRATVERAMEDDATPTLFLQRLHRDGIEVKTRRYTSSENEVKVGLSFGIKKPVDFRFREPVFDHKKYGSISGDLEYNELAVPDASNIVRLDHKYVSPSYDELVKEVAAKNKYRPNKIELAVRASRLGPNYSISGLSSSLSVEDSELTLAIESFQPIELRAVDFKLMAAIDYGSKQGQEEAIDEGAEPGVLQDLYTYSTLFEELEELSGKEPLEVDVSLRRRRQSLPSYQTSESAALGNYESVYGSANPLTRALLKSANSIESGTDEFEATLNRMNDKRLSLLERPDPRVLSNELIESLNPELREKVLRGIDALNGLVLKEPELARIEDRKYYRFNKKLNLAIKEEDPELVNDLLTSDPFSVDVSVLRSANLNWVPPGDLSSLLEREFEVLIKPSQLDEGLKGTDFEGGLSEVISPDSS